MIKKGTWVEVEEVVLTPEERSTAIPEETRKTPLKMWAKGHSQTDSEIGQVVEIETVTGRHLTGVITEIEPRYTHDFGDFIEEIMYIGPQARAMLWGDKNE